MLSRTSPCLRSLCETVAKGSSSRLSFGVVPGLTAKAQQPEDHLDAARRRLHARFVAKWPERSMSLESSEDLFKEDLPVNEVSSAYLEDARQRLHHRFLSRWPASTESPTEAKVVNVQPPQSATEDHLLAARHRLHARFQAKWPTESPTEAKVVNVQPPHSASEDHLLAARHRLQARFQAKWPQSFEQAFIQKQELSKDIDDVIAELTLKQLPSTIGPKQSQVFGLEDLLHEPTISTENQYGTAL